MKSKRDVLFGLVIIVASLFQQGCVTDVSQAKMGADGGASMRADEIGAASAEPVMHLLNVQINIVSADKEAGGVGDEIRKIIESELVAEHLTVSAAEPDITVDLAPHVSLFDKSGSYYRYNGKVDVRVLRSFDQRVMGEEKIIAAGERKLDQDEALLGVSQKMGAETAKWVAEVCMPVQHEFTANDITVNRFLPAAPSSDSRYAILFVEKVGALAGVASCRLVRHDYETRTMVFRVIYSRDLMPSGLMDQVGAIHELRIRVK